MVKEENCHGVINARYGRYNGKLYLFTHRNPGNGYVWSDDIETKNGYGRWVPADSVTWL